MGQKECVLSDLEVRMEVQTIGRKVSKTVASRIPPPPQQIYEYLNGHIVGHYIMKRALSVAIYNHFCDITFGTQNPSAPGQPKNNQYQLNNHGRHQGEFSARCRNYAREKFERDGNRQRKDSLALSDHESPQEEYLSPIVARVIIEASSHKVHLKRSNALTFDSTGSSRPLDAIADNIAFFLEVPYVRIDCSLLVSKQKAMELEGLKKRPMTKNQRTGWLAKLLRGYTGETVDGIVGKLFKKAEYDIERAQRGIIFLDAMDKIGHGAHDDDEDGEWHRQNIMKELMELIEGKTIHLTRRAIQAPPVESGATGPSVCPLSSTETNVREEKEKFQINSANLFFICFGVEDETERDRRDSTASMDTSATTSNNSSQGISTKSSKICSEKSFQYASSDSYSSSTDSDYSDEDAAGGGGSGLYNFQGLKQTKLAQILLEAKNSPIPQFQNLWGLRDVEVKVTPEALELIADKAHYQNAGSEGVRTILEKLLFTVKFEILGTGVKVVEITEDAVMGKAPPIYHYSTFSGEGLNRKHNLNTITEETSSAMCEFDQTIMESLEL
ncbi:ATP-dependent Clp protease ATP-binding subunit ClpX-like isoform X2 [Tigriopus californicus]|uniref:ATP-dependent Clp protease ATP-binding subunit ClpX-like isoform X2 n=1 Tax=Tigriopus californicus TaxID=6832 RepID=UPI0027DA52A0|nr:ATP-dependent Clp protease ATP-binding subunit ClpX-like isoform X2 [Tigriopus californicus]